MKRILPLLIALFVLTVTFGLPYTRNIETKIDIWAICVGLIGGILIYREVSKLAYTSGNISLPEHFLLSVFGATALGTLLLFITNNPFALNMTGILGSGYILSHGYLERVFFNEHLKDLCKDYEKLTPRGKSYVNTMLVKNGDAFDITTADSTGGRTFNMQTFLLAGGSLWPVIKKETSYLKKEIFFILLKIKQFKKDLQRVNSAHYTMRASLAQWFEKKWGVEPEPSLLL